MRFESQTHPQDDHIDRKTDCSTLYGQAPAVCPRVSLAKMLQNQAYIPFNWSEGLQTAQMTGCMALYQIP